jgi:hypothetical protein
MYKQRLMIINYPVSSEKKFADLDADGRFVNTIPIHEWLGSYYWSRINADYVLLLGEFPFEFQRAITEHPAVEVMPSILSRKKLGATLKKTNFWAALKANLGVDDNAVMDDLLDLIEEKHGPIFAPLR